MSRNDGGAPVELLALFGEESEVSDPHDPAPARLIGERELLGAVLVDAIECVRRSRGVQAVLDALAWIELGTVGELPAAWICDHLRIDYGRVRAYVLAIYRAREQKGDVVYVRRGGSSKVHPTQRRPETQQAGAAATAEAIGAADVEGEPIVVAL